MYQNKKSAGHNKSVEYKGPLVTYACGQGHQGYERNIVSLLGGGVGYFIVIRERTFKNKHRY